MRRAVFYGYLMALALIFSTCPANAADLELTGSLNGYYYSAEDVYTDGTTTVDQSSAVTLSTFNTVTLNPGFHVVLGGTLSINKEDTDADGLLDSWEMNYFGNLSQGAAGDPDGDGLTNLQEFQAGTNPNDSDSDNDGMPDGWEVQFGLNPLVNDASGDLDNDGFTNYQEYTMGTDPSDPESGPGAQDDVDFGIDADEQQGGGGLVGETIRVFNGNVIEARSDLSFSSPNRLGLTLEGFYNSRSANSGSIGYGWTHTYEATLDPSFSIDSIEFLKIIDATGKAHYFLEETSGTYEGRFGEKTYVELESGEYIWHLLDGSEYGFSSTGKLSWIDDAQGNSLALDYDANSRLETVTDNSSGRVLTFYYNASDLLDHVTGPTTTAVTDGVWVSYGYDANDNLTSVIYADDSGFDYSYTDTNDIHNLTEKVDKADHLINTWEYDTSDRAISNFSRDGKGVDIVYTSATQIEVTDAYSKEREYILDEAAGRKRVSAITDGTGGAGSFPYSDSNIISWIYDVNMNPTELEYPSGIINQYLDFDERGNPATIKLAFGEDEERDIYYTYHPYINTPLTRTEDSVLGTGDKETIWDYDNDYDTVSNENPTSLISRIVEKGYTKNESGTLISYEYVTTYTYNTKGQVLSINGPLSGTSDTTTFTYNSTTGNLLTVIRPIIGTTTLGNYDAAGQAGTITDVNSQTKTYTYDGRGRVVELTNSADSSTSSVDYDIAGTPEVKTDEDGVTTEFEYDPDYGRLYRRYDHEGNYIEYSYDAQGNVTAKDYYDSSNNLSKSTSSLYIGSELPGLLYREINADSTYYTQYSYGLDGNVASVRDPNGNYTYYAYDSMNRLVTVTQPGSIATGYTYDGHGNLHTVTDAENHTTTYEYDDMARLVSTTSPDTGTVTYAYDEAGNPINKTDAEAISIDYTYDVLNRLTDIDFPTDADIAYSYDSGTNGIGQRTGMEDESGEYIFGYNSRGRLTSKTILIDGTTYSLSRSYTPGGRVSSMTYPTGRTINYYRTSCACKVDSITTTFGGTTTTLMEDLTYRPFGGASAMNNGAGGTIGSTYNTSGRLTVSNPGATHERTYNYYNNGNLLTITAPSTPYYDRTYVYDPLNRLTSATAEDAWGVMDYTYDDVGNRLTEVTDTSSDTYAYVTGTNLLSSVTGTDNISYTYDDNGNITGMGTKTLNYNEDNRLVSVVESANTLGEYTYNGLGQRIIKEVGSTTTVFLYDFDGNIIGESDETGDFSKEYLYRGSSRLAMVDVPSEEVYYYGNDQLGTPEILTDDSNTVVWEAYYKPFGEAEVNSHSTVDNNFRFSGQYFDLETGLHYNYNRYYNPSTGRYLTPDPIGQEGGINLFAYVENNPVNETDPKGLVNCARLLEKINNIQERIDRRSGQLDEDKYGLPESAPNDDVRGSLSRQGHRRMINMDKAYLAALKALYLTFCSNDPPNACVCEGKSYFSREYWENQTKLTGAALVTYLIISEGSRLYPPRNLVPVP
jgi:RHS repeat-associated protein